MVRFSVLGPGGVGGFLAAALTRAGEDVGVVARESTAELIARSGIAVSSVTLGDFIAHPKSSSALREPVDVLFLATKATGLEAALARVSATPGLIIPLLNGLDHVDWLRQRYGRERVPAATIRIEANRPAPGQIVHTSPSVLVEMTFDDPERRAMLSPILDALNRAGVTARLGTGERQVMWSKLARLNALATTTTASGQTIGKIRSDPEWRATLIACIEETAATANADGAGIDPRATLAELDDAHPGLGSSMQRDLGAGRTPELDAIQGSVLRAAARHGLSCPTVATLAEEIARRAGLPPPSV